MPGFFSSIIKSVFDNSVALCVPSVPLRVTKKDLIKLVPILRRGDTEKKRNLIIFAAKF